MQKVLAVATNNATELKGKTTGLWLSELTHFLDVIERAGLDYEIASPNGGRIPLDERSIESLQKDPINAKFMARESFRKKLEDSVKCSDINPSEYVAIYLAGGHGTVFDFRQSTDLQILITRFHAADAYLSGVCHGVSGFLDSVDSRGTRIIEGKRVTGFSNAEDTLAGVKSLMPFLIEDEFEKNGALYKKSLLPFTEHVEVDGKLITGQNPQSAQAVGEKLIEALKTAQ